MKRFGYFLTFVFIFCFTTVNAGNANLNDEIPPDVVQNVEQSHHILIRMDNPEVLGLPLTADLSFDEIALDSLPIREEVLHPAPPHILRVAWDERVHRMVNILSDLSAMASAPMVPISTVAPNPLLLKA